MESQDALERSFLPVAVPDKPIDKEKQQRDILKILQGACCQKTLEARRDATRNGLMQVILSAGQEAQRDEQQTKTGSPATVNVQASKYVGVGISSQQQQRRKTHVSWECQAAVVVVRAVSSEAADACVQSCTSDLLTAHDSTWSDGGGVFAKGLSKGILSLSCNHGDAMGGLLQFVVIHIYPVANADGSMSAESFRAAVEAALVRDALHQAMEDVKQQLPDSFLSRIEARLALCLPHLAQSLSSITRAATGPHMLPAACASLRCSSSLELQPAVYSALQLAAAAELQRLQVQKVQQTPAGRKRSRSTRPAASLGSGDACAEVAKRGRDDGGVGEAGEQRGRLMRVGGVGEGKEGEDDGEGWEGAMEEEGVTGDRLAAESAAAEGADWQRFGQQGLGGAGCAGQSRVEGGPTGVCGTRGGHAVAASTASAVAAGSTQGRQVLLGEDGEDWLGLHFDPQQQEQLWEEQEEQQQRERVWECEQQQQHQDWAQEQQRGLVWEQQQQQQQQHTDMASASNPAAAAEIPPESVEHTLAAGPWRLLGQRASTAAAVAAPFAGAALYPATAAAATASGIRSGHQWGWARDQPTVPHVEQLTGMGGGRGGLSATEVEEWLF